MLVYLTGSALRRQDSILIKEEGLQWVAAGFSGLADFLF
jgi:hypothetical protein